MQQVIGRSHFIASDSPLLQLRRIFMQRPSALSRYRCHIAALVLLTLEILPSLQPWLLLLQWHP
jgi:hypothetical protein